MKYGVYCYRIIVILKSIKFYHEDNKIVPTVPVNGAYWEIESSADSDYFNLHLKFSNAMSADLKKLHDRFYSACNFKLQEPSVPTILNSRITPENLQLEIDKYNGRLSKYREDQRLIRELKKEYQEKLEIEVKAWYDILLSKMKA